MLSQVAAQQKYFEGTIAYSINIKSKLNNVDDHFIHKILAMGDLITIYIKNGFYRQNTGLCEIYFNPKERKCYYKFRKLDTLYFMDYISDTNRVTDIVKTDSIFKVNNIACKAVTIKTSKTSKRFYYSTTLMEDPEYDKDNSLGQFNVFSKETGGSIYLWARFDYSFGTQIDSCIRIDQKSIDDHVFDLPALPIKIFSEETLRTSARFQGKEDGWQKYLTANLDSKVGLKYLKLPKGQREIAQSVIVEFFINEDGSISNIQVVNKNEIHPKLGEEAIRVLRESPRWVPATIYGEKIMSPVKEKIVFKVTQ
jgi:hypothetical protein